MCNQLSLHIFLQIKANRWVGEDNQNTSLQKTIGNCLVTYPLIGNKNQEQVITTCIHQIISISTSYMTTRKIQGSCSVNGWVLKYKLSCVKAHWGILNFHNSTENICSAYSFFAHIQISQSPPETVIKARETCIFHWE